MTSQKENAENFTGPGAFHVPPVHLEKDVLAFLSARAEARGMTLNELVNQLLKRILS